MKSLFIVMSYREFQVCYTVCFAILQFCYVFLHACVQIPGTWVSSLYLKHGRSLPFRPGNSIKRDTAPCVCLCIRAPCGPCLKSTPLSQKNHLGPKQKHSQKKLLPLYTTVYQLIYIKQVTLVHQKWKDSLIRVLLYRSRPKLLKKFFPKQTIVSYDNT